MKEISFLSRGFSMSFMFTAVVFWSSCSEFPVTYCLETPPVPAVWLETLGTPCWRFEWMENSGRLVRKNSDLSSYSGAEILQHCTNPILAFPYWPQSGVVAGVMKPAGALFPFDVQGGTIKLSFQGGVDAVFFCELAAQQNNKRLPQNFDWMRFRALRIDKKINEEAWRDPWIVDWKELAEKTSESGFYSQRIKPRETVDSIICIPADGPWFGTSPFTPPFNWKNGDAVVLRLSTAVNSYFCKTGILRVTDNARHWIPKEIY
ncbi:MAG: hypothetical protein LBD07_02090 [Spirochaetaceae bacterium]|jgi:hypothetical protein|nr:hypothetical protein [Spirochaetaceae bacterium]